MPIHKNGNLQTPIFFVLVYFFHRQKLWHNLYKNKTQNDRLDHYCLGQSTINPIGIVTMFLIMDFFFFLVANTENQILLKDSAFKRQDILGNKLCLLWSFLRYACISSLDPIHYHLSYCFQTQKRKRLKETHEQGRERLNTTFLKCLERQILQEQFFKIIATHYNSKPDSGNCVFLISDGLKL